MDTLPCEILSLITSYLLPKYQCRLAIMTKWLYQSLYTYYHRYMALITPSHKIIKSIRHYYYSDNKTEITVMKFRKYRFYARNLCYARRNSRIPIIRCDIIACDGKRLLIIYRNGLREVWGVRDYSQMLSYIKLLFAINANISYDCHESFRLNFEYVCNDIKQFCIAINKSELTRGYNQ